MPASSTSFIERRAEPPEQSIWWNRLSLAQKFAASSLGKFGYELAFVRNEQGHSVAVMFCGDSVSAINEDGDINATPNISLRKQA